MTDHETMSQWWADRDQYLRDGNKVLQDQFGGDVESDGWKAWCDDMDEWNRAVAEPKPQRKKKGGA